MTRNRPAIAARLNLFLSPVESLRHEGAPSASAIMSGPAPRALQKWVDMQRPGNGDSVFLTESQPCIRGEVVELGRAQRHSG
jgi:enoyl-CoA hydratase